MYLKDQACLLRKAPSGEHHSLLYFFLKEGGRQIVLSRRGSTPARGNADPDLFESGDISIERKGSDKPAFLREFQAHSRFPGIARGYASLTTACRLTRFYELNLRHMEHFEFAWDLLHTALAAFAEKQRPQPVLLKSLFLFARHEGYPVKEEWLATLPSHAHTSVAHVLQSPVEDCEVDASVIEGHIRSLEAYFLHYTDLILPDA